MFVKGRLSGLCFSLLMGGGLALDKVGSSLELRSGGNQQAPPLRKKKWERRTLRAEEI